MVTEDNPAAAVTVIGSSGATPVSPFATLTLGGRGEAFSVVFSTSEASEVCAAGSSLPVSPMVHDASVAAAATSTQARTT